MHAKSLVHDRSNIGAESFITLVHDLVLNINNFGRRSCTKSNETIMYQYLNDLGTLYCTKSK